MHKHDGPKRLNRKSRTTVDSGLIHLVVTVIITQQGFKFFQAEKLQTVLSRFAFSMWSRMWLSSLFINAGTRPT